MKTVIITLNLLLIYSISCNNCATLPPGFKKCDIRRWNFEQCLGRAINGAIEQLYRPLHDYDLPSLGIVNMPDAAIELGESVEGLHQKFTNFSFYGLTRPRSTKASMDFGANILKIETDFPVVEFDTFYEAHGTVVLLPIDVRTEYHVLCTKATFKLVFKLEEYGESPKFYRVLDLDILATAEHFDIEFKDLFGNKTLNDAFNAKLTKHGVEIIDKFAYTQKAFAPYFIAVFNNLLGKVPKGEIFGGVN